MERNTRPADPAARFAGRRIYLTGAASGIGRATAQLLAEGGAALALVDVDAAGLDRVAAATGGTPFAVDLRDGAAVDRSVEAAGQALGGLDGIVNCAGVAYGGALETLEASDWDRVIAINLTAPYRICRAALPLLRLQPAASIVNVASGVAIRPNGPGATAYAASKGGLLSFTKALAAEVGPSIRANVVCPGIVDTPMTGDILHHESERAHSFLAQYAMKRAADPLEVAAAIAFLMSGEASFVTGITLSVDGGRSFH